MIDVIMRATLPSEKAPHGKGNLYAPEVVRASGGLFYMYYGGYGRDGHDKIHLAISRDLKGWTKRGVVLPAGGANHVNDPSIVRVNGTWFMYYTQATTGIEDVIALATSRDGMKWVRRGVVLSPGEPWCTRMVGRPSVLYEGGVFRLWYDGRTDLTTRAVGYAESRDGLTFTPHTHNPVYLDNAGAVDVERVGQYLVMVYEGGDGTHSAISTDGIHWAPSGMYLAKSGKKEDAYGHVTPQLFEGWLFFGAATGPKWDQNCIARARV